MSSDENYKVYFHRNRYNGKVYVGCTKKSLTARFDNGNGYDRCTRFFADIVKYGFDNFDHILVRDGMTRDEAMELEDTLIRQYDAMNPEHGHNMRQGGEHNIPCEEVGRHISESKMGHVVTEETREKLRQYGNRRVVQISLDGVVIQIFPSLTEAAHSVNSNKTNIYAVCRGIRPTCRGYSWQYEDEFCNDAKRAEERDRVKHLHKENHL